MNNEKATYRRGLTFFAYAMVSVVSVALGSVYLFSPEFMPYHSAAISTGWSALEPAEQTLYSALLRVIGGGWIGIGVAIGILLWIPFRQKQPWASVAILAVGLIFYLPTLYATLIVTRNTPAVAPWYGNVIAVVSLVGGFALTRK